MEKSEQILPYYRNCFVCGEARLGRLGVRFKIDDGKVKASFTPTEKHVGFPGIVHGGIITALLDEAMVWAIYAETGQFALSAEITVRFIKPLSVGQSIEIVGYVVRRQRKIWEVASEIHDEQAIVYARAWGRFVAAKPEENENWQNALQTVKT
ncbi:MAG: PaaI family thioesterase [Armatimonadetes bacterium]|nr:PaaI family thioesterase [Armatimonadota bacterium]MDW8029875.1 PaaI family thioesterase [Armatimonadota bacterium]